MNSTGYTLIKSHRVVANNNKQDLDTKENNFGFSASPYFKNVPSWEDGINQSPGKPP